jgi:hypothetical protein
MCLPCRFNIAPLLLTESEDLLKTNNTSRVYCRQLFSQHPHPNDGPYLFRTLLTPMFRSILLAALSAGTLAQSADACRFKNGTALPSEGFYNCYQPCPGSSVCCALNRDNTPGGNVSLGLTRDECLPNGLCQNRATGRKVATQWAGAVFLKMRGHES